MNARNVQGFTLVELMVALVLGMIVSAAAIAVFMSNRQVYTTTENLGRAQETVRTAYELMSHAETEQAVSLIRRLTEGRTLVIVEHDMSVVFGLADRISVLVYGHIIATGTPDQIRSDPKVKEAYLGEEAA